jgi:hypothetical protein
MRIFMSSLAAAGSRAIAFAYEPVWGLAPGTGCRSRRSENRARARARNRNRVSSVIMRMRTKMTLSGDGVRDNLPQCGFNADECSKGSELDYDYEHAHEHEHEKQRTTAVNQPSKCGYPGRDPCPSNSGSLTRPCAGRRSAPPATASIAVFARALRRCSFFLDNDTIGV